MFVLRSRYALSLCFLVAGTGEISKLNLLKDLAEG